MYLSGDKLYTSVDKTLYVYLVSDINFPIATYSLSNRCSSGMISDNRLYLSGNPFLKIFDLTTSLSQPLSPVKEIKTKSIVFKILRAGHSLLLGELSGWFEIFDINTLNITSTHKFEEAYSI